MDDEKLRQCYEMFTAAWKLFKAFHAAKDEQDRLRLKVAGERLYQKYPRKLMRELIWCVFHEIERIEDEDVK